MGYGHMGNRTSNENDIHELQVQLEQANRKWDQIYQELLRGKQSSKNPLPKEPGNAG
jgi:hypothetical protein